MPRTSFRLYVIAGDQGEVRLVDTYYPEAVVRNLATARNHRVVAVLGNVASVDVHEGHLESLSEYVSQVADEPHVRKYISKDLMNDIIRFMTQNDGEEALDTSDAALYAHLVGVTAVTL